MVLGYLSSDVSGLIGRFLPLFIVQIEPEVVGLVRVGVIVGRVSLGVRSRYSG